MHNMLSFASCSIFLQQLLLLLSLFYTKPIFCSSSVTLLKPPEDALALLAFKSGADPNNETLLDYSKTTTLRFCEWQGVKCTTPTPTSPPKVIKLVLQNQPLSGILPNDTLSRLDQLRVLILRNVSLSGPIPSDLSKLYNLKNLFLDHNYFLGSLPPSLSSFHRLRSLVVSFNNLTGAIPSSFSSLDRLSYLGLEFNRFDGSIPQLNQSSLLIFNVSHNNLSGPIPVTTALLRFTAASFTSNPNLCGKIIHKECRPGPPFFNSSSSSSLAPPPALALGQSAEVHGGGGVDLTEPDSNSKSKQSKKKKTALIIGFSAAAFLVGCVVCFVSTVKSQRESKSKSTSTSSDRKQYATGVTESTRDGQVTIEETGAADQVMQQQERELEEKVKRMARMHHANNGMKSGSLQFCAGEAQLYTIDQLMRGSAELLGRGSVGTTYKAVLDNRLIVCVKRLDAGRIGDDVGKEGFERHMEAVGGLRHPNLVPLRAYFQAREERLLIYDYQPNGSLFSLIHGSKSTRAKPLHWTSCLKIAEDVAQGLSYIHQAWRLVHGNLKSTNVLLGHDFEACITDYCLSILINPPQLPHDYNNDPNAMAYKAPETRTTNKCQTTSKSDVYAFGILLLELLTCKHPSQLPYLGPTEMVSWVRTIRDDDDREGNEEDRLEMLVEVAMACSLTSPEQRPTMWQVLKMLQEIKDGVASTEDMATEFSMLNGDSISGISS